MASRTVLVTEHMSTMTIGLVSHHTTFLLVLLWQQFLDLDFSSTFSGPRDMKAPPLSLHGSYAPSWCHSWLLQLPLLWQYGTPLFCQRSTIADGPPNRSLLLREKHTSQVFHIKKHSHCSAKMVRRLESTDIMPNAWHQWSSYGPVWLHLLPG